MFVAYGTPLSLAAAAVLAYRVFQLGLPAIFGAFAPPARPPHARPPAAARGRRRPLRRGRARRRGLKTSGSPPDCAGARGGRMIAADARVLGSPRDRDRRFPAWRVRRFASRFRARCSSATYGAGQVVYAEQRGSGPIHIAAAPRSGALATLSGFSEDALVSLAANASGYLVAVRDGEREFVALGGYDGSLRTARRLPRGRRSARGGADDDRRRRSASRSPARAAARRPPST